MLIYLEVIRIFIIFSPRACAHARDPQKAIVFAKTRLTFYFKYTINICIVNKSSC